MGQIGRRWALLPTTGTGLADQLLAARLVCNEAWKPAFVDNCQGKPRNGMELAKGGQTQSNRELVFICLDF
jgi:hypothetical protein